MVLPTTEDSDRVAEQVERATVVETLTEDHGVAREHRRVSVLLDPFVIECR